MKQERAVSEMVLRTLKTNFRQTPEPALKKLALKMQNRDAKTSRKVDKFNHIFRDAWKYSISD